MKNIVYVLFLLITSNTCVSQTNGIRIEITSNKIIGLLSFIQAGKESLKIPGSQAVYIHNKLGDNKKFNQIIEAFSEYNFSYSTDDLKHPLNRNYHFWIAAAHSANIEDFGQRIIRFLPHHKHTQLINLLSKAEPFYDHIIIDSVKENVIQIKKQLTNYQSEIGELFFKTSNFYNMEWNKEIPFKIILNPLPLKSGRTVAIAVGNVVICDFLSLRKDDYKDRLGVIFHEMCHILFLEQSTETKNQINAWFAESTSQYAILAHRFINEAMATAIGNGWAYEKLQGEMDDQPWYSTKYIDGFAHAIFPLVKKYIEAKRTIDKEFINTSILLFQERFPKILSEIKFLMSEIQLYMDTTNEEASYFKNAIRDTFGIRSLWSYSSIDLDEVKESFKVEHTTKVFVLDSSNNDSLINQLGESFPKLNMEIPKNSIISLKDPQSQSTIIIIHLSKLKNLTAALNLLSKIEYLDYGKTYKIQ